MTGFSARTSSAFSFRVIPAFGAALAASLLWAVSASAVTPAPGLTIESFASPTNFSPAPGAQDAYELTVTNAGSVASEGPITITDMVPAGLTVQRVSLFDGVDPKTDLGGSDCNPATVQCVFPEPLAPDGVLRMIVSVTVDEPALFGPLPANAATVSGGGAPNARTEVINDVSVTPAAFGAGLFSFFVASRDGRLDTQAGDHPYEVTTTIGLNNDLREPPDVGGALRKTSVQDVKDVAVDLPLGFVGSTLAAPECTLAELSSERNCPRNTVVGHLLTLPQLGTDEIDSPIWNLVPERGVPAEFGYKDKLNSSHVLYTHVTPTPAGYVLEVVSPDIPQISLDHIVATFYGDPAQRDESGAAQVPFFTNPTICSEAALTSSVHVDSWLHPGRLSADGTPDLTDPNWVTTTSHSPPPSGCDQLQFTPELFAQPTTTVADSPTGLDFELKLPQAEGVGTLATPPLKKATVLLPAGVTVDPSAGNGLQACSESQIGWTGPAPMNFDPQAPSCPQASKIGNLELTTPLIPGVLTGQLYLASQDENPFGSVLAAYVVVDDPQTGVLIKIAGKFMADPETGRLTAVFDENPQLPFSDLKLHFFGGPRAELATPEDCGSYTTTSALSPWSTLDSGPDANPFDSFQIDTGCVTGFNPSFTASDLNVQAGAFGTFVASFSREDTDQPFAGLSVTLPPGLLAKISGVPLCPDAQAAAGTCPEDTRVGSVLAEAGPGPNPLAVNGRAFLTGPYKGAPYGLSVVVPAVAGPFNFGNVVVRQALHIDPTDAQVTDVSDPFPTILTPTGHDGVKVGIPIKLRRVDVSIDRPGFAFNPTSCAKLQLSASVSSTKGATAARTTPFQVTNCAALKFAPKFAVSTSGKTSKANGASLTVKLAYPNALQGTQANIARVKVDLPKQLPSRLTTLQKACTAAQFSANPAGCPAASIIGHATVHTPILPQPLTGPAVFVSHGGEAFPSLIMVLQGNGVTLDLVGTTFISKAGITSSTFKTVPDAPVGTFELTLPQGKYSALAANGNLCASTLAMPTEFLAQNGAKINESTPVSVTGCAKKKSLTRAQKLAAALKACKKKSKAKRAACQASAHRRYGLSARKKSRGKGGRKG